MSRAFRFLQRTAEHQDYRNSYHKNFIPKYLDTALTDSLGRLNFTNIEAAIGEKSSHKREIWLQV